MATIKSTNLPRAVTRRATAALFSELQDLKRIAPASIRYSLADDLFVKAWQAILNGAKWDAVADSITCQALLYVLFPGVDQSFFAAAGLHPSEVAKVCDQAFERTVEGRVTAATAVRLRSALAGVIEELSGIAIAEPIETTLPGCLERLREQPRAGATHPEHPRLVLLPAESHADHCLMTAVYAALSAEEYGASVGEAFVCGLAHHLHNAFLPDCGWAGELALEPYLAQVIGNCRTTALSEFTPHLRQRLSDVLLHHETIATPVGLAISSGDVLDRVLDVKWRVQAAAVTDVKVLGDLDLVHPGPLKDFQTALLNETELWITR
ncbi:hypothetical protein [Neolewinella antarctica]|uniref:HD domain-containing protein n=1 Tax=Neolewinella antarctica TaxID=442734 RepID=A0ABX0XHA8_9BACT|nr:hypothetical protein [Neolewinella antarctica]NJC28158.1 hypothetical protein [Neolewinella antarctica]